MMNLSFFLMFENPDLKALGFNDLEDFGHLSEIEKPNKNRGLVEAAISLHKECRDGKPALNG